MIKSQLVDRVAELNPHLNRRAVKKMVNAILEEISDALAQGSRVELRGFGSFSIRRRPARTGRNPKDATLVRIPEKVMPAFRSGKGLKRRLNRHSAGAVPIRSVDAHAKSSAERY